MKYLYTRKQIGEILRNTILFSDYPTTTNTIIGQLLTAKKVINVPEVRKNTEQMKKLDSERELMEIEKLEPGYAVSGEFRTKINELIDRVNQLSKKK